MKKLYIRIIFIIGLSLIIFNGNSQDLPLFTQKLTNSFLYNPSVAGNGMGSISFSNRSFWSQVPGAPRTNFLSFHAPFGYHKFGAGINILQEKISIYNNLYLNGAFAYHLKLNEENTLSFGVSSEYAHLKIDQSRIDVMDNTDVLLLNSDSRSSLDFSFGVNFRSKYFDVGLSSNRLATAFQIADFQTQISQFYTGYIYGKLQAGPDHFFEPMFTYRHLTDRALQWDLGMFYTYKKSFILGTSYRQGGVLSPAFALKFKNKYLIGYSFEMFGSQVQKNIGNTNEITLRLDIRDDSYVKNTRNSGVVMENAVAFRRKTMTTNTFRSKPISASSSKYKNKLRRNYIKSPDFRTSNSSKLEKSNNRKVQQKKGLFYRIKERIKERKKPKVHQKPEQRSISGNNVIKKKPESFQTSKKKSSGGNKVIKKRKNKKRRK